MSTTTTAPAATIRELEPREAATYDWRSGLYTAQRRWEIIGVSWTGAMSVYLPTFPGVTIPEAYTILHAEDGMTPVEMIAVTRHGDKLAQKPDGTDCCILTVTYEGHVCLFPYSGAVATTIPNEYGYSDGVMSGHFEFGTKSERIIVSLDRDATGQRIPIGTPGEYEGTNRLVPNCRLVITQNVSELDFYNRVPMVASLIGVINEDAWEDPVLAFKSTIYVSWYAGMWLYLGPQVSQNRDGTYTLQHQFEFDARPLPVNVSSTTAGNPSKLFGPGAFYFHKFLWYDKRATPQTGADGRTRIVKTPVEPPHLSAIYETAGAGVALGYQFADLFRPVSVLV